MHVLRSIFLLIGLRAKFVSQWLVQRKAQTIRLNLRIALEAYYTRMLKKENLFQISVAFLHLDFTNSLLDWFRPRKTSTRVILLEEAKRISLCQHFLLSAIGFVNRMHCPRFAQSGALAPAVGSSNTFEWMQRTLRAATNQAISLNRDLLSFKSYCSSK